MKGNYANGLFTAGRKVRIRPSEKALATIYKNAGVVAQIDDRILRDIRPGEVPVRFITSPETKMLYAETVVVLLRPEQLEVVWDEQPSDKVRPEVSSRKGVRD